MKILLEKIYETNRRLIKHSDVKTQMILEKEWNDLQKSIHGIDLNIKQRCDTLVTVSFHAKESRRGYSGKVSKKDFIVLYVISSIEKFRERRR